MEVDKHSTSGLKTDSYKIGNSSGIQAPGVFMAPGNADQSMNINIDDNNMTLQFQVPK